jgi:hypothetical protein
MSALFQDPRTGIYYFRKVIPQELRPAFGKREYKVSLGTRDPVAAKSLMPDHAAAYERLALNAKAFLRGGVTARPSHYVDHWLHDTQLDKFWLWDGARALTDFTRLASGRGLSAPAPDYVFEAGGPARERRSADVADAPPAETCADPALYRSCVSLGGGLARVADPADCRVSQS